MRSIYGMLVTLLLLYKKCWRDLENIGFELYPYDPCVPNSIKVDKQHPLIFHVDGVMYSHVNPKVDDKFKEWMNRNYGNHGEVKANIGKVHEYLGLTFDFT